MNNIFDQNIEMDLLEKLWFVLGISYILFFTHHKQVGVEGPVSRY